MKILTMILAPIRGGAEEYALTIAKNARRVGHEIHVGLYVCKKIESLKNDFINDGCRVHHARIQELSQKSKTRTGRFLRLIRTLMLLLKIRPDCVHLTMPAPTQGIGSIIACSILNIPTLVVFQLVYSQPPYSRRAQRILRWCRNRRQSWVCVSENNRHLLKSIFNTRQDELTLIYNGAKVTSTLPLAGERIDTRERVRRELGLSEECKILMTVAALRPQKGHEHLIPTIPHILKEFPNTCWVWAGEGEWRQHLTTLAERHEVDGNILFLGHRDDVPGLLCAADLFVFPTRFEGQPFALLEAMAAGLPIVTTNASGIPEVLTHMKHALICKKEDVQALKTSILYALRHPDQMKNMAKEARFRVRDFSEEIMTTQTIDTLTTIVNKSGSR